MGDDVFEGTLRVGCEETYCCCGMGIERMWEEDFAWFEPFLVDNMFLCSYEKPYWTRRAMIAIFRAITLVGKEVFCCRRAFLALSLGFNMV